MKDARLLDLTSTPREQLMVAPERKSDMLVILETSQLVKTVLANTMLKMIYAHFLETAPLLDVQWSAMLV